MILAFSLGERVVNHLARRCEEVKSDLEREFFLGSLGFKTGIAVGDESDGGDNGNAPLYPGGRGESNS